MLTVSCRLKDCDVTWLYGPLQTHGSPRRSGHNGPRRHGSFPHKQKPILKKRSMSEVMLQRSLSSSSLLKQATAAVQAQQKDGNIRLARPNLHRAATTDYVAFPFSSRRRSDGNTSSTLSTSSSGIETPAAERKHIHFDEQVQQCIAVDVKGDEDEADELEHARWAFDDSDSDDGAIMMKRTRSTKNPIMRRKTQSNPNTESKTIAMLPSTTLKYRVDSPEPNDTAMKHSSSHRGSLLSHSASQETLRPSRPSGSLHYDEDDEDALVLDDDLTTPFSSPVDPTPQPRQKTPQGSISQGGSAAETEGLRRTDSGMLMPVEESGPQTQPGLVGRVVETVNTARDIVHVIWNVGWR